MLPENHVHDLIPGYALDCLNEKEKRQVAEHLALCHTCQTELETYLDVVNELHLAVPPAPPPTDLKSKILRALQPRRAASSAQAPVSAWQQILNKLGQVAPVWAYASFALVVLLAVSNLWMMQRINRLQTALPDEFRTVALTGSENAPTATGLLVLSQDGNLGTLVVDNLPALDQSHQYQLWLIRDGQRASGGVFSVSADGYATMAIASDRPLKEYSAFGITIEPTGGSPGPTGDKILGGNL